MKIALVHDWLTGMRGGEKVLEALCEIFPDAPIYTLVHTKGALSPLLEGKEIYTSFLQKMPFIENKYRHYLPLMPLAISQFDLSPYNLIFSISHCVAKGVKKTKKQIHVCYCNTPMRYIWDSFSDYFSPQKNLFTWAAMKFFLRPYLRWWDKKTAKDVDYFIANSRNVSLRIKKFWERDSEVIYPPVDTDYYNLPDKNNLDFPTENFYLVVSALVPYKKIDLAVTSFNRLGKKLKIIGTGPEEFYLKKIAGPTIEFLGWQDASSIREHYQKCKALIFPGEEDFGIVPVEAQACGKPVIAYAKGGALETVIDGKTGVFFEEQNELSLCEAVERFESLHFDPLTLRENALRFSKDNFIKNIKLSLDKYGLHLENRSNH